jgi:hypothetical protein
MTKGLVVVISVFQERFEVSLELQTHGQLQICLLYCLYHCEVEYYHLTHLLGFQQHQQALEIHLRHLHVLYFLQCQLLQLVQSHLHFWQWQLLQQPHDLL